MTGLIRPGNIGRVVQEPKAPEGEGSDGFKRVIVELDWYDGVRAGIAEIAGVPHYFRADDYTQSPNNVTFLTWPIDVDTLTLEIEQWCIFVEWNDRYEAARRLVIALAGSPQRHDPLHDRSERRRQLVEVDS